MIATITVLVTGLTLATTLDDAEAKDNKIVITGTTGNDNIVVDDRRNKITCILCAGLTVTGPVTGPFAGPPSIASSEIWMINPEAGSGVDDKYIINGNGGIDRLSFFDGLDPDNDKVEIENVELVRIFDHDGDDKYKIKGFSGIEVRYFDGPGDNKLEVKG